MWRPQRYAKPFAIASVTNDSSKLLKYQALAAGFTHKKFLDNIGKN